MTRPRRPKPNRRPRRADGPDAAGRRGTDAEGGAVATIVDAPVAHPAAPAERVTFRSKFLMPLLVPLGVAATIVFYILNVSRVFLAVGGSIAVTYAAVITVVDPRRAAARSSASPKVRSSSITLMIGGSFLLLLMGGLISIGAASPKTASGPVQCTPVTSDAHDRRRCQRRAAIHPAAPRRAKAGCIQIKVTFDGTHTLQFDDPAAANVFPLLDANLKTLGRQAPGGQLQVPLHRSPATRRPGWSGTLTVS